MYVCRHRDSGALRQNGDIVAVSVLHLKEILNEISEFSCVDRSLDATSKLGQLDIYLRRTARSRMIYLVA